MLNRFHAPLILLLFAMAAWPACGREVTVRLYTNQPPEELTLIRGGIPAVVKAASSPVLHVAGPWQARIPGQETLALSYPLDVGSKGGRLTLTVRMPLEEYVQAVLAGESIGFRSEEGLAAMAVAARTYSVRYLGRHKGEGYDFCDTTHCQDLHIQAVTERLRQAVEATEGEMLWFEGAPASTFYGKDCGGTIEAGAAVWPELKAPYLNRHEDPYCARATWKSAIRKDDLRRALLASGIRTAPRLDLLTVTGHTASGRALRLQAGGMTLSASSLRFAAGRALGWSLIPSDLYEVSDAGDRFVFEGRGSGNGIGLCQAGADRMGKDGHNYREILDFYYPGTALGVSAQGFHWQSLGGAHVTVITTRPREDRFLVALADRLAQAAEDRSGLRWQTRPALRIYPAVAAFRDATGEPGWVAASARGSTVRMQPVAAIRALGSLDDTLLHELLHALIESRAKPGLPLWFREGAVLYLTGPKVKRQPPVAPPEDGAFLRGRDEARRAYASALNCFSALVDRFSEATVLSWISTGLPPAAKSSSARK